MLDSYDEQDFDHLVDDMKLKKFRVPRSKTARSIVNRLLARKGYAQVEAVSYTHLTLPTISDV